MEATSTKTDLRRANLGDAMILLIALGAGLAFVRQLLNDIGEWSSIITPTGGSVWSTCWAWWLEVSRKQGPRFLVIQGCVQLLFCVIIPLTPALLVARLRRPRPTFRSLACQPGLLTSVALCLVAIIEVEMTVLQIPSLPIMFESVLPGATVLTSWVVLVASRRWQPEPSWVDRAGRLVGVFWIATIPWMVWLAS